MNLINLIVSRQIRSFRALVPWVLSSRFAGFKLTSAFQAAHLVCKWVIQVLSLYNWPKECLKSEGQSKFSQNREASAVFTFQLSMNWCGSGPWWSASPCGLMCMSIIGQRILLGEKGNKRYFSVHLALPVLLGSATAALEEVAFPAEDNQLWPNSNSIQWHVDTQHELPMLKEDIRKCPRRHLGHLPFLGFSNYSDCA